MQHLNPFRFYELAAKLHGLLGDAAQARASEMLSPLTETQAALDNLLKGDPVSLETSRGDATRLLNKISGLFNKYFIDPSSKQLKNQASEDRIDQHEIAVIGALVEKFEHALAADLSRAPTYTAEKRGIYSTYDLIENADQTFGPEMRAVLSPLAMTEFKTAGRALAFGLGTAASLHLLRAIEITLKHYYELYAGAAAGKTERSYNIYLKKLAALADDEAAAIRPDKRLLQMLAQIKEHYRNPLTSVESTLTVEQATSLFGLAAAAIALMGEQIAARQKSSAKDALQGVLEESDEGYDFSLSQAS